MTETQIEHVTGTGLALTSDQAWWNERQQKALQQLGVERATQGDLLVFMHVAQRTGLDPFARQIYMIQRDGKQTIQTGIDGFRLVARRSVDRSGERLSIGPSEWADSEGNWTDVWLKDTPPAAARVIVYRGGEAFPGIALWREYVQTKRDGAVTAMWKQRPAGQLAKCAEALALRKAFPMDLAGIYTDDEMAQADARRGAPERPAGAGLREFLNADGTDPALADDDVIDGEVVEDPKLDMRSSLAKKLFAVLGEAGITDERQHEFLSKALGREVTTRKDLTDADARTVIDALEEALADPTGGQ